MMFKPLGGLCGLATLWLGCGGSVCRTLGPRNVGIGQRGFPIFDQVSRLLRSHVVEAKIDGIHRRLK
jgi:hypothetical protein